MKWGLRKIDDQYVFITKDGLQFVRFDDERKPIPAHCASLGAARRVVSRRREGVDDFDPDSLEGDDRFEDSGCKRGVTYG